MKFFQKKKKYAKFRSQVEQILANVTSDKVTIPHICSILQTGMFLDKFQDLLGESLPEDNDGVTRTYLQAFLNALTPDNFPEVLVLLEKHNSRLIQGKVSMFVSETLQSSRAKIILEKLITSQGLALKLKRNNNNFFFKKIDVKSLGLIAYAMQFFNEVPVEIYPYSHQLTDLHNIIPKVTYYF